MRALTYKNPDGRWGLRDIPWEDLYEGKTITKTTWQAIYGALYKLKDYEETGLTPNEVEKLMDDSGKDVGNGNAEKAIRILENRIDYMRSEDYQYQFPEYYEALKVAVAVLKGQPVPEAAE